MNTFAEAGHLAGTRSNRVRERFESGRTAMIAGILAVILSCSVYAGIAACGSFLDQVQARAAESLVARFVVGLNGREREQRADPARARDAFERFRANWLYALNYRVPIEIVIRGKHATFSIDELLLNMYHPRRKEQPSWELPWTLLNVAQYDQLPRPVLQVLLHIQDEKYRTYLSRKRWPQVRLEEWKALPVPIQKTAAYRMVWEWTRQRDPRRYRLSQPEAARILASIGLVESLFDLDKIRNFNEKTGNEDRGYMQVSDSARQELHRVPEFRDYTAEDYYNPWVSIQAGSYFFFNKLMERAEGDALKAIGMYNAGPRGKRGRKARYRTFVVKRYQDTFLKRERYSPTRSLIVQRAQAGYFEDLYKDRLFRLAVRTGEMPATERKPDKSDGDETLAF